MAYGSSIHNNLDCLWLKFLCSLCDLRLFTATFANTFYFILSDNFALLAVADLSSVSNGSLNRIAQILKPLRKDLS
jgi:hypothetical protein